MAIKRFSILAVLFTFFAGAVGCGEEPPPPPPPTVDFPVSVSVKTPSGVGVAKVPVLFGEKTVGYTDADGNFEASLNRQAGSELQISVGDANGYRYMSDSSVTENLKATDVGGKLAGVPLGLEVEARSTRNDYFFWVHAKCDDTIDNEKCQGLEVKIDDEVVATTNELGYAQFMLSDVPETEIEVLVDTPDYDPDADDAVGMEPRDPTYKVTLDLESQVYMIEEGFVDALAKAKKKRVRRRAPRRRRSRSSRTRTKKKTPKKEKKDDGIIDLF